MECLHINIGIYVSIIYSTNSFGFIYHIYKIHKLTSDDVKKQMEKLNSFLNRNEGSISVIRWILFPIVIAACFWTLDGRYVQKGDWSSAVLEQRAATSQISAEQKVSLNRLTDAITTLTNETRMNSELQRSNNVSILNFASRLDKHEVLNYNTADKISDNLEKIDARLNSLELSSIKHEVNISRLLDGLDKQKK